MDVVVSSIYPPSTVEQWLAGLGVGAQLSLVVWSPYARFCCYHSLQQSMGVLFQGTYKMKTICQSKKKDGYKKLT
jgi:hypothetical protein